MIRELKYDQNSDKYVLYIENETDLKDGKMVVGKQKQILTQVWDKEHVGLILEQLNEQEKEISNSLKNLDKQMSEIGKIKTRERQVLKDFSEKLQKVQKLQKLEGLETTKQAQLDALEKIKKDKKEVEDAISHN